MDCQKASRVKFTEEEDRTIVAEILNGEKYRRAKGAAVWVQVQAHPKLKNHTPRSCQKRFLDNLSKNLEHFNVSEEQRNRISDVLKAKEKRILVQKRKRVSFSGQYSPAEDMSIFNHILNHEDCWNTSSAAFWSSCELQRKGVRTIDSLRARARHLMLRGDWDEYTLSEKQREILEHRKHQNQQPTLEGAALEMDSDVEVVIENCASVEVNLSALRKDLDTYAAGVDCGAKDIPMNAAVSTSAKHVVDSRIGSDVSIVSYTDDSDTDGDTKGTLGHPNNMRTLGVVIKESSCSNDNLRNLVDANVVDTKTGGTTPEYTNGTGVSTVDPMNSDSPGASADANASEEEGDSGEDSDQADVEGCQEVFKGILESIMLFRHHSDPRAGKYVETTTRLINVLFGLAFPSSVEDISLELKMEQLIGNLTLGNVALEDCAKFLMDTLVWHARVLNGIAATNGAARQQ